jgi:phage shock protein E
MQTSSLRSRISRTLLAFALIFGASFSLSACTQVTPMDRSHVTAVIDVRTPAEYAAGHLQGAVNIDWNGSDFDTKVASLDKNGEYVLYCKSGNRAGQALTRMQSLGFTHVSNAGGVNEASAMMSKPIVK